ncbi:putative ABC transporter ATP-binding protein YxlF [Thalassoglobus neptunius]|uniref:Putative ABC transporter ATP-binding protein YxlF n=1 Tax=Thalassoglobus neptunius TaxID=1938619 RepID=A0A5C5WQ37_9PLAN|nr:ABC transporter ATP-binding protein [Thalassoglobus neptunius]TWT51932.1 putative ABC transporter ATP-binding protein YxlF [Thalassoglobus neptunius]
MTNSNDSMICLSNISRRFGSVYAVENVSLDVPRGATLGLLGMNGAGKSTTLRILMGLLKPHAGSVTIDDKDVVADGAELRTRIGYVPERPTAYSWMTVGEVMMFCKRLQPHWHDQTADEMLKSFRLDAGKRISALSKGMATKLHLLLALSHRPTTLILDEPLSGLDPVVRDEFLEGALAATCERDCTVVLSSHQVDDVQRLADRVAIMHEGQMLLDGGTESMLERAARLRLALENNDVVIPSLPGLIRNFREHRSCTLTVKRCTDEILADIRSTAGIISVERIRLSLADLFKDIVLGIEQHQPTTASISGKV